MSVPDDRQYTSEHEWVVSEADVATIGITDFAADALGDVVYVDLPGVGDTVTAGEPCGEIESTKSVSELYAPVSGEVIEVNTQVDSSPESVNADPYGEGWLFRVRISSAPELLEAGAYAELVGGASA